MDRRGRLTVSTLLTASAVMLSQFAISQAFAETTLIGNAFFHWGCPNEPVIEGEKWLLAWNANVSPAGIGSSYFDCSSSCVGTILGELEHLKTRYKVNHQFGCFQLYQACPSQIITVFNLLVGCRINTWVCITESNSTQGHTIIQISITFRIPNVGTFTLG